jgi:hypothetical protein
MTIKKMLMLVGAAMALVAFSAPAAQAEVPEWWIHTEAGEETLQGQEELHIAGNLSWTVKLPNGFNFQSGPCKVTFLGTAENVNGMAGGSVGAAGTTISNPCPTNLPGCGVEEVTTAGFPWSITGINVTGETGIEIATPTITNHYSAGCQALGLPKSFSVDGVATGILTEELNENGESCVTFDEHQDHLFVEVGGVTTTTPVDLDGEVCVTHPLTLK